MRKQTKIAAVVTAAAVVALGASITAVAAGWVQVDGAWYYENSNGDYVYDEWKRSGDNYFYLGSDGYMLTNQLIQDGDNYYFVDENGAMVKNQWKAIPADDTEDQDVDHRWYRFGSTGRAIRDSSGFKKATIDGKKYAFDAEGKMLFGWVDAYGLELNNDENAPIYATYFFGPNDTTTINGTTYTGGEMVTGWYNYLDGLDEYDDEGDDSLWFYFNTSTGKKTVDRETRIGNLYYHFDDKGVMDSGWTKVGTGSNFATESKYFSGSDQGWRQRNAWVWAIPAEQSGAGTDNADGTYRWFYVGSNGYATVDQARRINSKWYIFDEYGRMQYGLVALAEKDDDDNIIGAADGVGTDTKLDTRVGYMEDGKYTGKFTTDDFSGDDIKALGREDGEQYSLFYFSNDEENDGSMKTGTNVQVDLNDGTYTMGFARNGKAYDGVYNRRLYTNGILETGGDLRYDVVKNTALNDPETTSDDAYVNAYFVVGPTGTFASDNSTVRDADDNYYAVVGGYIFKVDSGDYASRIARAIVDIGQGRTDSYTYEGRDGYNIRVSTDEYVKVEYNNCWRSSYTLDLNSAFATVGDAESDAAAND